jgi:Histidine kinase-, DNA gyrase B-, and HSP90-like ATPase
MSGARPQLQREVFSTSRLAEFASNQGLITATGYGPYDWPRYIVKELVDNGLDDQEEHGIAPHITVEITDDRIVVSDQGSGLTNEVLDRIRDYRNRTSAREAYISPSRGAQGNALQTILAVPFALDGETGRVTVEAHSQAHEIEFAIHPLTREPAIRRSSTPSSVKTGTQITTTWPASASQSSLTRSHSFYHSPMPSASSIRTWRFVGASMAIPFGSIRPTPHGRNGRHRNRHHRIGTTSTRLNGSSLAMSGTARASILFATLLPSLPG